MARPFNINEVEITVTPEPEEIEIKGQFDSGDAEQDARLEKKIREELEWSEWAWCTVKVTASWGGFEGSAYLGAVSILDEKDPERYFRETHGYFEDLKDEAIEDLKAEIEAAGWELDPAGVQDQLKALAREIVGDGGSPNVFFVSEGVGGNVIALFVSEDSEDAISLANTYPQPLVVEDRQTGVVYDNPASAKIQRESDD